MDIARLFLYKFNFFIAVAIKPGFCYDKWVLKEFGRGDGYLGGKEICRQKPDGC